MATAMVPKIFNTCFPAELIQIVFGILFICFPYIPKLKIRTILNTIQMNMATHPQLFICGSLPYPDKIHQAA